MFNLKRNFASRMNRKSRKLIQESLSCGKKMSWKSIADFNKSNAKKNGKNYVCENIY